MKASNEKLTKFNAREFVAEDRFPNPLGKVETLNPTFSFPHVDIR